MKKTMDKPTLDLLIELIIFSLLGAWIPGFFLSRLTGLHIPQIWREYQGFQSMYGSQAWIVSLFNNLYYLMEFILVVLISFISFYRS